MTPGDPGMCSSCGAPAVLERHGVWWHKGVPCPERTAWLKREARYEPEFVPVEEGKRT